MDNFQNLSLSGNETPQERFERFIAVSADSANPGRSKIIFDYFENTQKLLGDNSPLFIAELSAEQIEQAAKAVPLAGEFFEVFSPAPGEYDSVGDKIPHPHIDNALPFHEEYMVASSSKPLILYSLLASVPQNVAKALTNVSDMRYLPKWVNRPKEDPATTATNEPVEISAQLQQGLEHVLSEARSPDRVTKEEAEKELRRLTARSEEEVTESDIAKYLQALTQHPLSFKSFVDLTLHYSCNLPLRFLRFYLAEAVNNYEQPLRQYLLDTEGRESADVEDTTILRLAQNYINFFAPGYTMLSGNIWIQPDPNVGTLQPLTESFHKLIERCLTQGNTATASSEKFMLQAMLDNPRDVGFWNDEMNQQVKDIIQQAFPDKEIESLYVKTGDYPHIRYVKTLPEKGDPCHSIYTVLISVKFKDSTLKTFGMWEKYLSLLEADIESMDISEEQKEKLKQIEEQYSAVLHTNICTEFRSRAINALKSHLQLS